MVTTGTDAKRRQGKGEEGMEVRYDRGRVRAHPTEENEIEVREARTPVLHRPSRIAPAEEWVARSLINTAARFLLRRLFLFFYYSTFTI